MPRGGPRQGTPGKGYSNRTDLALNSASQTATNTAASGGVQAPAPVPTLGQPQAGPPQMTPDMVPRLDDPTARPGEPVTAGLPMGPGPGPEALAPLPLGPADAGLLAAFQRNPTPELRAAIMAAKVRGAL